MSTILKALRRLEAEQSGTTKSAPPPETPRPKPDRPRVRALWLALAIGAALGFSGAALWTFFGPTSAPEPLPSPVLASNPPPGLPPPAERAPKPDPVPAAAAPAIERAAPPAAPLPAPRAEILEPPAEVAPKPEPAPTPQPAPTPPPAPVFHAVADPAPAPSSGEEPSPLERPAIPHVVVAQTQWHPDQALRRASVELEGRDTPLLLRIGDAVGPLIVTRIDPSGVVFRMGDVEIRRRVGER